MSKAKSELVRFEKHNDVKNYEYFLAHNNGTTTLEQNLHIEQFGNGFQARISFKDFPLQPSTEAAAKKLADWLERLAEAIRSGEYHEIK